MPEQTEPIAIITDYDGLVTALRQRLIDLGTSLEAVDHVAGVPEFYTSKVLSSWRRCRGSRRDSGVGDGRVREKASAC
jgi:hypothetical protein